MLYEQESYTSYEILIKVVTLGHTWLWIEDI